MAEQTIVFRADGGTTTGMGHFVRTIALAEMLNEDFHCVYATCSPSEYQVNEISRICHDRIDLPGDETHFEVFMNFLKGDEIVVLDNYFFTSDDQKAISAKGCQLVCIDDICDQEFFAGLIINQLPWVREADYRAQPYTQFALGAQFALLRKAFSGNRTKEREVEHFETVLICFGGSDHHNLTVSALEVVSTDSRFRRIIVVTGDRYGHEIQLKIAAGLISGVEIYKAITGEHMSKLMSESDLAIIPAGGTLLEAMKTGLAVITGYYVPNQRMAANYFGSSGLAINLGDLLIDYQMKLKKTIASLSLRDMNELIHKQESLFKDNREEYIRLFRGLADRKAVSK